MPWERLRRAEEFLWHLLMRGGGAGPVRVLGGGPCGGCAGTRWIAAAP